MFDIWLLDGDGKRIVAKEIKWNNLPTVGQKVILEGRAKFSVTEVSIFIDENSLSEPTYLVFLEQEIESSPEDFGAMS